MLNSLLIFIAFLAQTFCFSNEPRSYILGKLTGQTGNLCFQIATAHALAWDHGAEPYFPDLCYYPHDVKNIFFRCHLTPPSKVISCIVQETFPMPYKNKMKIQGYFQSEKYFAHHRQKILELFAPSDEDLAYIQSKYSSLLEHSHTVGVQLRYYRKEVVDGYPQYGLQYLEKAMAHFSENTLFIVSSDNLAFAKQSIPSWIKQVHFLEEETPYIDLFLLSMCKDNIISNSTFGWWSAWLNQNPDKVVVCPAYWTEPATQYILPVCPEEWIHIQANPEDL